MGRFDNRSVAARKAGSVVGEPEERTLPGAIRQMRDNPELAQVGGWLSRVTFRKKLVGGVDPEDVWRKLEELNALYENALVAERARCNLLIRQLRLSEQQTPEPEGDTNG